MLMRQVMEVSRSSVVCEAAPPGVQMSLPVTTGLAHPNAPAQTPVAGPVRGLNTSATALTPALRPPFLCVTPLAISHAAMKAMLKRTWCACTCAIGGRWQQRGCSVAHGSRCTRVVCVGASFKTFQRGVAFWSKHDRL